MHYVTRGGLKNLKLPPHSKAVVITDATVARLYKLRFERILIPKGEAAKQLSVAEKVWHQMLELGCDRQSLVIGLGGGSVCDLAGFVASCYMRGIRYVQIPTTLLAMCDAAIGGKTGVNLATWKNYIGSIHQPEFIIADPECLKTLPRREFWAGVAEIIKMGAALDLELFELLENSIEQLDGDEALLDEVIKWAGRLKLEIVAKDEKDLTGRRALLNFGHTYAHAIEALLPGEYLHGEAVSIGMVAASGGNERLKKLCERAHLPVDMPPLDDTELASAMQKDKKGGGFVTLEALGKARFTKNSNQCMVLGLP